MGKVKSHNFEAPLILCIITSDLGRLVVRICKNVFRESGQEAVPWVVERLGIGLSAHSEGRNGFSAAVGAETPPGIYGLEFTAWNLRPGISWAV